MAAPATRDLDDLRAGQRRLREGQEAIAIVLREQAQLQRALLAQLRLVLDKLTPDESDGPTLQELLAAMVAGIADNSQVLRRIDRRIDNVAEAADTNGNGTYGGAPTC